MYEGRLCIEWYPAFDNWTEKAGRRSGKKKLKRTEIARQALRDWDTAIRLGRYDEPEEIRSIHLHYVTGKLDKPSMKPTVMSLGTEFEPIFERIGAYLQQSGVYISRLYRNGLPNTSIIAIFALYRAAYRDLNRLNVSIEPARLRAPQRP